MRRFLPTLVAVAFLALVPATSAQTATETTLYSLCSGGGSCTDGWDPLHGLIQAADGNFYGTADAGGSVNSFGTIFKLTPAGDYSVVYTFTGGNDGAYPQGQLIQAGDGYLYGTACGRGADFSGTIFKVTPAGAFTLLYTFTGGNDGSCPPSGVIEGSDGNFYGISDDGGVNGAGTIFEISSTGAFSVVYPFDDQPQGFAGDSLGALVQGIDGNFYGTARSFGADSAGTVFKLTPAGSYTLLYTFTGGTDGGSPFAGLVQSSDGNFYGTTLEGGTSGNCYPILGCGTVFKISPSGYFKSIYSFTGNNASYPESALLQATDGNFYGTTGGQVGNDPPVLGEVFKITPSGTFSDVFDFVFAAAAYTEGTTPLQGSDGSIYNTSTGGGSNYCGTDGCGTIYNLSLSPALAPPVQLTLSESSVAAGSPVTLSWKSLNAFSTTMQQCYAFIQNNATGAGTWTGKQSGTYSSSTKLFTGSATIIPTAAGGTYTYALTCGGIESGFATLTVTTSSKSSSTTTLTVTPNPASVGQSVTLTATITGSGATPTGSVTFSYGSYTLLTSTLNAGSASFTASTNGLPVGTYGITAKYSGDSNYNTSSGQDSVKLEAAPTATTLTATPTSVTPPASVTLTATVKRSATGASGTPTGSVTFYANGNYALVTVKLNASGVATITASSKGYAAGKYPITAKYLGDSSDVTSTSSSVTVTVQ